MILNVVGSNRRTRHRYWYGARQEQLSLGGLLAVLLVLPISDTARGQVISLLGIIISASIALSSGTIVSNAMAGVMIRVIGRRLNIGDTVVIEGHEGRITELGLFAA